MLENEKKNLEKEVYTIGEYLDKCKEDKITYATAAERMLKAIGEPELVNMQETYLIIKQMIENFHKIILRY
jgi:predicted Ser/Thr protein kinase